ncbi:hypothetical protein ABPG75_004987 [Micractinium tetrahymenae]
MATGAVAGARPAGLASLGARLGLIVGQQEAVASLNPADYVYATPPADVLKRLAQEQAGPAGQPSSSDGANTAAGSRPALQGAAALPVAAAAGAPKPAAHPGSAAHCLADDLFAGQLDLDDDCLRLLLGEDAAESGPCASAAGSGKGPAAGSGGSGASQRSSATDAGAAPGGEGEAASLPAGAPAAVKEEDDDIAMLFGELREPLDLHLLAGGHHQPLAAAAAAERSDDAGSAAGADADPNACHGDLASPSKRAKGAPLAAPAGGLHLALSMDYERAAESINLELLGAGGAQRK